MEITYLADCRDVVSILAAWIYDEWSYLYPETARQDIENFLQERMNREKLPLTLVAFEEGEPVGTVSMRTFDMETRRDLPHWITSLYVVTQWRRRGIGTRLIEAAEKKAAELEIGKLYLFTTDAALPGAFYAKLGWHVKEKTVYRSVPVIILEKDLHPLPSSRSRYYGKP